MMKQTVYVFLLLILTNSLNRAQENLVPNPSFEEHKGLPKTWGESGKLTEWYNPLLNSTPASYFVDSVYTTEKDCREKVKPHSGKAFAGLAFALQDDPDITPQYLSVKLKQPLKPGADYVISLYARSSSVFQYGIEHIGAVLLTEKPTVTGSRPILAKSFLKLQPEARGPIPTGSWTYIQVRYKARGGEQYLLLGGFTFDYVKTKQNFHPSPIFFMSKHVSYYFLDDVSVKELPGIARADSIPVTVPEEKTNQPETPETRFVLSDLTFEINSARLQPSCFPLLDSIAGKIRTAPNLREVFIDGHTDSTGTENDNLLLSEKRARAVSDYLVSKGIDGALMHCKGYGSTLPLEKNNTEAGRAKNRRVEITLVR